MDRLLRNEIFLINIINTKIPFNDRIQLIQQASDDQLKSLVEVIINHQNYLPKQIRKCFGSIFLFTRYDLRNLNFLRKVFKIHIPSFRLLIPEALCFVQEYVLSRELAQTDDESSESLTSEQIKDTIELIKVKLLAPPNPIIVHEDETIEYQGIRDPFSNFTQLLKIFTQAKISCQAPGFELFIHVVNEKNLDKHLFSKIIQPLIYNGDLDRDTKLLNNPNWKTFEVINEKFLEELYQLYEVK